MIERIFSLTMREVYMSLDTLQGLCTPTEYGILPLKLYRGMNYPNGVHFGHNQSLFNKKLFEHGLLAPVFNVPLLVTSVK